MSRSIFLVDASDKFLCIITARYVAFVAGIIGTKNLVCRYHKNSFEFCFTAQYLMNTVFVKSLFDVCFFSMIPETEPAEYFFLRFWFQTLVIGSESVIKMLLKHLLHSGALLGSEFYFGRVPEVTKGYNFNEMAIIYTRYIPNDHIEEFKVKIKSVYSIESKDHFVTS